MKHQLQTGGFSLELELTIFESDITFSTNSCLEICVQSDGFSATIEIDIDVKQFAQFAVGLKHLYESLAGSAKLEEPYGVHNYIKFEGKGNGHILANGRLCSGCESGHAQELYFENEFDQTYLKTFSEELYIEYKKYLG